MKIKLPRNDDNFNYYCPHTALSPYIAYYSITTPYAVLSSISPQFIPDLGGSIIINRYHNNFDLTIWGPFNKMSQIENCNSKSVIQYFVEFQPGGLSRLIYPNSKELLNQKILLKEIDGNVEHSLQLIFDQYGLVPSKLVFYLDQYFLELLDNKRDSLTNGRYILNVLQNAAQGTSTNNLSRETHYSARHINRYLNSLVGVSSKSYLRIKRVNRAVQILKETPYSIEAAAFLLGYYDTAHFIHDFTMIVGISPGLYRRNMSAFYSESTKEL